MRKQPARSSARHSSSVPPAFAALTPQDIDGAIFLRDVRHAHLPPGRVARWAEIQALPSGKKAATNPGACGGGVPTARAIARWLTQPFLITV